MPDSGLFGIGRSSEAERASQFLVVKYRFWDRILPNQGDTTGIIPFWNLELFIIETTRSLY